MNNDTIEIVDELLFRMGFGIVCINELGNVEVCDGVLDTGADFLLLLETFENDD